MATRVAVLSDTHGLLRPEVMKAVGACDVVIHAGDFDNKMVLDTLQRMAPVYAVRGNNDWYLPEEIPMSLDFCIENCRIFVVHDKKDIPSMLGNVDVVIYGHSHQYDVQDVDGRLWLNPGSCGRPRIFMDVTYAIMTVTGRTVEVEKCIIDTP